jgi:hypothetical protein
MDSKMNFHLVLSPPPDDWDVVTKTVFPSAPKAKEINKKIGQIKADLERHFDWFRHGKKLLSRKQ